MSFRFNEARGITIVHKTDVTDPDDLFAWRNADGTLRDFTDWTLVLQIIDPATNVVEYEKASGVVGSDGSGLSNVAIAWQTLEMAPLVGPKRWKGRIVAVLGGEKAEFVLDAAGTYPTFVFEPPATTDP